MTTRNRKSAGIPAGGEFTAHAHDDSDVNLAPELGPWSERGGPRIARTRTRNFPSGRPAEVEVFDEFGTVAERRKYADSSDPDAPLALTTHMLFENGRQHDVDGESAVRTFHDDGSRKMALRYRHDLLSDGANGEPALTYWADDGAEVMHIHHSAGKIQDPAPGVPAHVSTLSNGMSRSTFYTQDVVTSQVDKMPLDVPGYGTQNIVVTRTAE